jgi:tetratricopeptide (TPR) repeat protein
MSGSKKASRPKKAHETTILKHHTFAQVMANLVDTFNQSDKKRGHSSLKHIDELAPILLDEMQIDTVHSGRYLLCRTVENPVRSRSIATVVQDQNDEIENVYFYNFSNDFNSNPKLFLPKFSILLIKEPYVTPSINEMNELIHIRVESPSDVIVLSNIDFNRFDYEKYLIPKWIDTDLEQKSTLSNLTRIADDFFRERNFNQALRFYTKAVNLKKRKKIECSDSDMKHFLNNRSTSHLELENYYLAYQDALRSTELEKISFLDETAFFNMGAALYSMRQFKSAREAFQKCVELNPNNSQVVEVLERTEKRLNEAKTGNYDLKGIIEEAKFNNEPRLDLADFVSEDLEIVNINNDPNNKGVFAKNDIKKNTLILASKAVSITYGEDCDENTDLDAQNLASICFKVNNDPYLASDIYELYSGPVIDRQVSPPHGIVHTARLESILTFNSYISTNDDYESNEYHNTVHFGENEGMWLYPSYFNHSCLQNTKRIFFADFMMIYTSKFIFNFQIMTFILSTYLKDELYFLSNTKFR